MYVIVTGMHGSHSSQKLLYNFFVRLCALKEIFDWVLLAVGDISDAPMSTF